MKTLLELEPLFVTVGGTLKNTTNYIERIDLVRNFVPAGGRGKLRLFRHHEAVFLVCLASLVTAGAAPGEEAAPIAAAIARAVKAKGKPSREWLIYKSGAFGSGISTDETDAAKISEKFGIGPLCFVPVGAIVRMVDDLYAEGK